MSALFPYQCIASSGGGRSSKKTNTKSETSFVVFKLTPVSFGISHLATGSVTRPTISNNFTDSQSVNICRVAANNLGIAESQYLSCHKILRVSEGFYSMDQANDAMKDQSSFKWVMARIAGDDYLNWNDVHYPTNSTTPHVAVQCIKGHSCVGATAPNLILLSLSDMDTVSQAECPACQNFAGAGGGAGAGSKGANNQDDGREKRD